MTEVLLTRKQQDLVESAAKKCGINDFSIFLQSGSIKGDNYLGIITAIVVEDNQTGKKFHLILKKSHENDKVRSAMPIAQLFHREVFIYDFILKEFSRYQKEKNVSRPFRAFAECYGTCLDEKEETIIMKNLKTSGYSLWDRTKPMNDTHVSIVLEEYARFHAVSLALHKNDPKKFKELTKDIRFNIFESGEEQKPGEMLKFVDLYFENGLSGTKGNAKATAALKRLRENISTLFMELRNVMENEENYVVIHGDCWCNNFLFKYEEDESTPTKVCFLDWQLSKVSSPVIDLSYFFCVNSSKEVLHNLDKYLKRYHDVLTKNLQELGCNPEEVFNFDSLLSHWKKYSWFGVFMACFILKLMLSESEEAPDISDSLENGASTFDAFDFNVSKTLEYSTRICDLVEFMSDNDYI